jgi:DeoR/GlpR family transcriptional regulator of sugar metabolism
MRGEKNPQAKLEERDVKAIRLLYERRLYTPTELAKLFGVSRELIHKIVARKVWTHV